MYELVLLLILVGFLLLTMNLYPKNYYIHGFLMISIIWFGAIAIMQNIQIEFCIILILFTILLFGFSVSANLIGGKKNV